MNNNMYTNTCQVNLIEKRSYTGRTHLTETNRFDQEAPYMTARK